MRPSAPRPALQFINLLGEIASLRAQRLNFLLHLPRQTLSLLHLKTKRFVLPLKGLELRAKLSLPISGAPPLNPSQERQRGQNDDGDNSPRPAPRLFLQILQALFPGHIELGAPSRILPARPEGCQSFSALRGSDTLGYNSRNELMADLSLKRFFDRVIRLSFADLGLRGEPVAEHLSALLTRFARTEQLYAIRGARGERLETVAELLIEIQRAWDFQAPDFDPFRERAVRQQIGDYTLFMTGVFREHVERVAAVGYYLREGKRAYQVVSEIDRSALRPEAPLFSTLADRFERYVGALNYVRKVHLRPELYPGPHQDTLRLLAEW